MPKITPLGVARQATLMARRSLDAAEDTRNLLGEERDERATDALVFAKEVRIWAEYAERQGWSTVARHCWAQYDLAFRGHDTWIGVTLGLGNRARFFAVPAGRRVQS